MGVVCIKRKFGNFLANTADYYGVIQAAFIVSYILMMMMPNPLPAYLPVVVMLVSSFAFLFYKDYTNSQKKSFLIFRLSIAIGTVAIIVLLLKMLNEKTSKQLPMPIMMLLGMLCFMIVLVALFYNNAQKEKSVENIKVKNVLGGKFSEVANNFDVVFCKNKQSNSDVWMKTIDRYLHQFVLGPTGCGKTSLILTPMLIQDMQKDCGTIVIDPKGDLANKVYAMGKKFEKETIYFNPIYPDCPSFNVLDGPEDRVIETVVTTFNMLAPTPNSYFQGQNENLIRKSIMVLKRLERVYTDPKTGISSKPATLIAMATIIFNTNNKGVEMVNELRRIPPRTQDEMAQNIETCDYFTNEYYPGMNGENGARMSKAFSDSSAVRQQVSNLIQNKYLRKVLNPENGKTDLNFDDILATGKKVAITTAIGELRQLGAYLGYFLILTLQAAIFRRPGDEDDRRGCFLYIDEFQKYSNPGFEDILTMGRSYRVGCVLATQSREQMTMGNAASGKALLEVIATNCRNIILFPGISSTDAMYFERDFGKIKEEQERHGTSRQAFSLFNSNSGNTTVSTQTSEVEVSRKSATDLAYKSFKEITYKLITDGSVNFAEDGVCEWIPQDLNSNLSAIAKQMVSEQVAKAYYVEQEEEAWRQEAYAKYLASQTASTNDAAQPQNQTPVAQGNEESWLNNT